MRSHDGLVTLMAVFMIAVFGIVLSVTTQIVRQHRQIVMSKIDADQAYYLAESGLEMASSLLTALPTTNVALIDRKATVYASLSDYTSISVPEGTIYLVKTNDATVISAAVLPNGSRHMRSVSFSVSPSVNFFGWRSL